MISTRSSALVIAVTSALALRGHADAVPCDANNYSKVAAAVQTLHANCASWAAYLASGSVWTCDSTCRDSVANLVDTLPECTFGGPYGQNYKQVVEGMVETCKGAVSSNSESTTAAPSSTTAAPTSTTATPSATTAAPVTADDTTTNTTTTATPTATTESPSTTTQDSTDNTKTSTSESTSASGSAGVADTPASDVSTTSGASTQTVTSITALVLVLAGSLLS